MTNPKNSRKTRATVTSPQATVIAKAKTARAAAGVPASPVSKTPARTTLKPGADRIGAAAPSVAKPKLVRDSFTIPKSEYVVLEGLKLRAANLSRPAKKSELLRAGVAVLNAMTDKAFLAALSGVPSLKTGRPKAPDATSARDKGAK